MSNYYDEEKLYLPGLGLKVIYKITFPTGKIYIGKDATDTLHYYGSVDSSCLESDFSNDLRDHFSIKKELLWKSDTVSDKELKSEKRNRIHSIIWIE